MQPLTQNQGPRFVAALQSAVRPRDRQAKKRNHLPPVVLIAEDGEGQPKGTTARRTVDQLNGLFRRGDEKLAPYACLRAEEIRAAFGVRPLTVRVAEELVRNHPRNTGGLPLPRFHVMWDVVQEWLEEGVLPGDAATLRDRCYDGLLRRRPGLRLLSRAAGADPEGIGPGWLQLVLGLVLGPLFHTLPRSWWTRLCRRRFMRSGGWYGRWRTAVPAPASDFFDNVTQVVAGYDEAQLPAECEALLLHAFLADLDAAAAPRWWSPWRRRRRTRWVVLLELPAPPAQGGAVPGADFLAKYHDAAAATGCAALVVVAVGPEGSAGQMSGERVELAGAAEALNIAGGRGRGGEAPRTVVAKLAAPDDRPAGRPDPVLELPRTPRLGPWRALTLQYVLVLALLAGSLSVALPAPSRCLGGEDDVASTSPIQPSHDKPAELYEGARQAIDRQNHAALAGKRGYVTVAHISESPGENDQQQFSESVPELRGIQLGQQEFNQNAEDNGYPSGDGQGTDGTSTVPLKVWDVKAGKNFEHVKEAVDTVIAKATGRTTGKAKGDGKGDSRLIGVVGFNKSLKQTKKAVRRLSNEHIPVVGTTATADEMEENASYFQRLAPRNTREARVESEFARRANIVRTSGGECGSATSAVVVKDSRDLYSRDIGKGFADEFRRGGGTRVKTLDLAAQDVRGDSVIADAAKRACVRMHNEPRTVLYWAARAPRLSAFLDEFAHQPSCGRHRHLTVLGGNDLTTAALAGKFRGHDWLRLYHTVHTLPAADGRNGSTAKEFNSRYGQKFGAHDRWRDDGRAALAHDALLVLYRAINKDTHGGIDRDSVADQLGSVDTYGASGRLDFRGGRVPHDKPLVILHHADKGSKAVLICGDFGEGMGDVRSWGPDDEPCPSDD